MPLFVGIFAYSTISQSLIHNIPIGIIDNDKSQLSREIIFDVNSTSAVEIIKSYPSVLEAQQDLSTKTIYALIVLPSNLQSNVKKGITQNVAIYYNAELVFIGKNIQSALAVVFKNKDINLKFAQNIATSQNPTLALGRSLDFLPTIISLYNPNSNFSQFLLTAILPCSWQLFVILCMIALLAKNTLIQDMYLKNDTKRFYQHLGAKFLINSIIFFAWWIAMSVFFYNLSFPHNGNIWILALNAIVTLIAYNSIGIFIYALIGNHTRAISIAAFYAAPSLAFVGITYPLNSMELFPTFWSSILPITRYIQVYIQQENYGIDNIYSLILISQNLIFLLFGFLGLLIYKKKKPI